MRWFFSEAIPSAKIPITRVEIGSASIVGELDLEGLNIAFLFCFKNCDFKEKINLSDATIIGFDMVGGTATEILADRLFVKGAMRLHAFGAKAPPRLCKLRLCGAEIRGNLDLRGCGLADAKRSLPLFADGLAVHGHVLLSGQASQDLGVHPSQLRDWVKKFADDPQHAFPGHGQMKPEQLEIARLKREVAKLKAERDILKKPRPTSRRNRREVRWP